MVKVKIQNNVGTIDKINGDMIHITPESWVPGLWAGVEGLSLNIFGEIYKVIAVDLDKRIVYVDRFIHGNITVGE